MDATCAIQASIHVFSLVRKYVSRILGTYQNVVRGSFFRFIGNRIAVPIKQKALRVDRTAAEPEFVASRPAAGGESCAAGFYFYL